MKVQKMSDSELVEYLTNTTRQNVHSAIKKLELKGDTETITRIEKIKANIKQSKLSEATKQKHVWEQDRQKRIEAFEEIKNTKEYLDSVPVNGFPDYRIAKTGRVWSCKSFKWVKESLQHGYYKISFCNEGKRENALYIHKLVAEHFLDNPRNEQFAHHKDGNRKNNHVDNIAWGYKQETFSYEEIERMYCYCAEGYAAKDIAKILGKEYISVYCWVKRHGKKG